jgi:hypothetical protein
VALAANGVLWAWGGTSNDVGKIPPPNSNIVAIAGGLSHYVLRADGTVAAGATTDGGKRWSPSPNSISSRWGGTAPQISASTDGSIVAWGLNGQQCPDPNSTSSQRPGRRAQP